jgi:hypothetical protein
LSALKKTGRMGLTTEKSGHPPLILSPAAGSGA